MNINIMEIYEVIGALFPPFNLSLCRLILTTIPWRADILLELVRRGFLGGALGGNLSLVCYHAMIITRNEQCTHNYLLSVQVSLAGHPSNHKHCA